MRIAVAKEIEVCERRVALVPDIVARLIKQGLEIWVEAGAGERAFFNDAAYEAAGATIIADTNRLWSEADILLKVSPPREREDGRSEIDLLKEGSVLISFLNPLANPVIAQKLAARKVTALSMEMIPRTTRAQSMDALSSQASIAGYKAVLIAAAALPKYFPMLTTAAGTIAPAKIFIMGAGVAGLQAIATARRLGAVVEAFDIRPAVKEEVQSLGAKFVEIKLDEETTAAGGYAKEISEASKKRTQEVVTEHIKNADVVITTAQVPGKKAPLLVTEDMVKQMKPGSVIVDIAAEQGGNCACTDPGRDIVAHGVTIIGPINLPSSLPVHASQLYAKNLTSLMQLLMKDKNVEINFADDIIDAACITHAGEIRSTRIKEALQTVTSAVS
ncbi:NAD(P)(+) transhydrogenase (Re/Si-specific) subunit alpha [Fischerella thermalis CCMEE 5273]|jgi:NAD(P) transhydrogenase subunit alpha|uniref:NAD(P) transhydrogenase subunit alpha part 1 n=2 Tax=Fischerella TaxID=1190 RepID=G6FWF9_9CYAN|nr:Re/Si-specific NAD(P)(+) transhydrogenase subunit alpha [Fischerella thermalis]PMB01559.1 NAD(P)(+) transhydrogenase (Re/Si-specific) subunit alpha [Fischerella thermalis CCMEE 5328]PMB10866.1 NAD(P)(+) transhydrogenase (Re/Si-specific) subunit alpha [Fischerella thermalis CCMEE 5273]EHC10974.1 NAD(P)(+) transhydrogenase (AB-specific) [Fischerella thermalis JSC-11]PLZ07427.1 NAD(P) transhydrogenase subunit alpha [Fischerella thermalis WC114]PLZ18158.1 NAD(P) transhydrogenase subunit alpha [